MCTSFNDAVNNSYYIACDARMVVNDGFEDACKEAVKSKFNLIARHLPREAEEYRGNCKSL